MNATSSSTVVDSDDLPSHLTLILDLNPTQWHKSSLPSNDYPLPIANFLAQVLIVINSHLASRDDNALAVIGAFPHASEMLYTSGAVAEGEDAAWGEAVEEDANSYRPFRVVDSGLVERVLKEMERNATEVEGRSHGGLVAAITKGLCHINKVMHAPADVLADGTAAPTTRIISPKILILSVSPDLSTSYIPLMNSIFAAQKLKVKIDVCKIYGPDTVFLQQASYLTGGSYVNVEKREALLQYIMMCFVPPTSLSVILATPTQDKIEFRAACFCHKNIVDVGYVCSVCLSIFCKPIPVCSTCRTRFPLKNLQRLGFGRQPAAAVNGHAKPALVNGSRAVSVQSS